MHRNAHRIGEFGGAIAGSMAGRIAPRVEFPAPDRVQWGAMSYQGSPAATSTGIIIIV